MKFVKPKEYLSNWVDFIETVMELPENAKHVPLLGVGIIVFIMIPIGVVACLLGLQPGDDDAKS